MHSFHSFLTEITNVENTIINLLRLAERPGTKEEGEAAMKRAEILARKHNINLDSLKAKVADQPARPTSNAYDPQEHEGVAAVFAMWDAAIKDADDHHHGFKFFKDAGSSADRYKIYKSAHYPEFELYIHLYHWDLFRNGVEVASGAGAGRFGPFRMILIMMDYIKRICDWCDQVIDIAKKAGYTIFKEPAGHNGYETWLHHKKNNKLIVRVYGYSTDKHDRTKGTVVAFDEKSSVPYFAKASHEDPKGIKTFTAALKANKPS